MNGLVLTASGAAEIEAAYQSGQTVTIRHVLIGDGGGLVLPSTPDEMAVMTSLYGEFGQEPFSDGMVNEGFISGDIVIDCKSYPGKTLRELGMVSASGTLIAYGRYPDTYLPDQTDSVIKEVILTLVLGLAHTQNVTLEVDPERAIITQEIGDRRYLQRKKNLSDVEDKGEAVENLGLKPTIDKAAGAVQRGGDTMTGKLNLPQTSAFGVNTDNALGGNSIALGDNDTGIKQNGDGVLDVYANSQHVFRFVAGIINSLRSLRTEGYITATGGVFEANGNDNVRVYSPNNPPPAPNLSGFATRDWVLQNTVQDIDHTAPVEVQFWDGAGYPRGTDGAAMYNICFVGGMSNVGWIQYRYTRKLVHGNWYIIA